MCITNKCYLITLDLPTPTLKSSLSENRLTCPYRNLTFTCETIVSDSITWKSDEYIGQGGRELQLSVYNDTGTVVKSEENPSTVAMLVDRYYKNGLPVLVCQLNITVSPNILDSSHSVTCLDADQTKSDVHFASNARMYYSNYITNYIMGDIIVIYSRDAMPNRPSKQCAVQNQS